MGRRWQNHFSSLLPSKLSREGHPDRLQPVTQLLKLLIGGCCHRPGLTQSGGTAAIWAGMQGGVGVALWQVRMDVQAGTLP